MTKLIPFWGETARPAITYYLRKVSHDLLGIVHHLNEAKYIPIFDERWTVNDKRESMYITFVDVCTQTSHLCMKTCFDLNETAQNESTCPYDVCTSENYKSLIVNNI